MAFGPSSAHRALQPVLGAVDQHDARAGLEHGARAFQADARRGAGDRGDLVLCMRLQLMLSSLSWIDSADSGAAMGDARAAGQGVDDDGDRQHGAGDHVAKRRRQIEQRQAAGDRLDDDDAEQRRIGAAAAAEQAGAADDGRRDGVEVDVAGAGLLAGRGKPRRRQDAAQRREHRAQHEGAGVDERAR